MRLGRWSLVTALVALGVPALLTLCHAAQAGSTGRASVDSLGAEANSGSAVPSLSADGRQVAFLSQASNLVTNDTNDAWDVFVHDRETGATERVSVASDGTQGDADAFGDPAVSADGRWVAFSSAASNLVADDANGMMDVFVHDRETGATERVSVASDGTEGNYASCLPALSADGRYVAFMSSASNLVAGDTNGSRDIFVHDRESGQTQRVSVSGEGAQGNGRSCRPSLSADGRYVAFESEASNLVVGDANGFDDIFVHDRQTGQTELVSVSSSGTPAIGRSAKARVSANSRYVVFESQASNLAADDTNGWSDVFLHDRESGQTQRVSVASDGTQANYISYAPSVSADGQLVAFASTASNLVLDDTNGGWDIFVHDRETSRTERVSVASDGTEGNDSSECASLSAEGRYVAFSSMASNLVAGDTNAASDVFVRERPVASFSGTPTSGPFPLPVTFSDLSTGGATGWEWDFGDGDSSTDQCPSHQYESAGSYTVTLTVTDGVSWDTEAKSDYITVSVPAPVADFSASPIRGRAALTVVFTDLSSNTATAWAWDFGDGALSTIQNPSHDYASAGRYTISLTASNPGGLDTEAKSDYVTVSFTDVPISPEDPVDHWALDSILACVGAGIARGYPDGTYHPDEAVTRAQMAVYVSRALAGGEANVPTGPATATFPDVPTGYWAYKHVEYCHDHDVVGGYWDGYHPEETVNRAQMAVFVARAMAGGDGNVPEDPDSTPFFPDVPAEYWAYKYVEYCHDHGVVGGYWDGYHPEETVNRAQMAVYVQRAFALPM